MLGRKSRITVRQNVANMISSDAAEIAAVAARTGLDGDTRDILLDAVAGIRMTARAAAVMAASEPAADPALLRADLARVGPERALFVVERYVARNLGASFSEKDMPRDSGPGEEPGTRLTLERAARLMIELVVDHPIARWNAITEASVGDRHLAEQGVIVVREALGLPGELWDGGEDRVAVVDACDDLIEALRVAVGNRRAAEAAPPEADPEPGEEPSA